MFRAFIRSGDYIGRPPSRRTRSDDFSSHHIFDRESVQDFPLSVLTIAKRLREHVAKEIALGHDSDDILRSFARTSQTSAIRIHPILRKRIGLWPGTIAPRLSSDELGSSGLLVK
jgi:hypothetical protein